MDEEINNSPILIVDDDAALLQALPQVVDLRMKNVQVETTDSAQQALELIKENDYDAIVSDVKMPGMDGIELLSHIRELRPDTPVVLITGHGDHGLAIKAIRGGAYDYILKPIDRDAFVNALQRAMQTRQLRRKVMEQQLALALHARSLERLVEKRTSELVAANATKDKFLDIVSQELKSPLSNLKGMTQHMRNQLERGDATTAVQQGLSDMERSITRTEVLVQDLLDTSLMETNLFALKRQRTDLVELCRKLLNDYTTRAVLSLNCELQGDPIEVEVDRDRFSQVLINLLSNARKFSKRGTAITITVQQSGYEVIISIQDMGIGIPEDALPHIFEQFYRVPGVEVQSGSRTGLGLGLFLARKIVERHGGHMEVQTVLGQGSVFSIVLPIYVDPDATKQPEVPPTLHTQAVWTITH
ncbi:hybrid sensor histidine kinase/response regulator [Dictyobacter alpinus]|uniref:histidine kinase n=1 Tax=Dictyobacter alpinus TaxID=2014873 RepID=A0A402BB97_9CHLR|nr:hybrid sensor histidine kinase/response regulator [Dictyobacter alpinus]GCE28614.1 hybrid sensor histidine kinase/response regulator [Dictyobacter alpinus]